MLSHGRLGHGGETILPPGLAAGAACWGSYGMLRGPRGGLWLELKKSPASERPIAELHAPARLFLPLRQFQGSLPIPCVEAGDRVYMGQPIADAADGISCALHSPVSGVVTGVTDYDHPVGGRSQMIVIENDGRDLIYEKSAVSDPEKLDGAGIIAAVKAAGVVSAGDFGPPLWVKLSELAKDKAGAVVINAVETEPYVCSSQKLMDENPDGVAKGLRFVMRCLGAERAMLAVGDDLPHETVQGMVESAHLEGVNLAVTHVPQKYPNGFERYLLAELFPHGDPEGADKAPEVGFVCAQDCVNVQSAVAEGRPQLTRVLTVAGDAIKNPQNLEVRIGTTLRDILEYCGLSFDPDRLVVGSAMRGAAVTSLSVPVTKSVGAVLALKAVRGGLGKSICINCGRCVGVCPQGLMPNYIAMRAVKADFDALRGLHINDCIECGSCAYVCPGHMPIVELIKNIKKAAL